MSTSMNVIVAINSDYLVQCETMIFSLLRHNVQYDIKIHILNTLKVHTIIMRV